MNCERSIAELLRYIEGRENAVHAWAWFDRDGALRQARALDSIRNPGRLHGLTVGVKDVIDTAGMPTACNSPIYAGHVPGRDAEVVRRLRKEGAVILGKTVTTEFAYKVPGPTRNPHDADCTPGGSSSGSAAAVACGMTEIALATQTSGSTIRPAAYCGVIGYKPAYGWCPTNGLKHLAPSLDTIGLHARSLDALKLAAEVMAAGRFPPAASALRFVVVHTVNDREAEPQALERLNTLARILKGSQATVREIDLPPIFSEVDLLHRPIMALEAAEAFAEEWAKHRAGLSPEMKELLQEGRNIDRSHVARARERVQAAAQCLRETIEPGELLLTLPAAGEAPRGLHSTGNAAFNRLWTLLGLSCLTLPVGRGQRGLPLGVQLVAPPADRAGILDGEASLLADARHVREAIAAAGIVT